MSVATIDILEFFEAAGLFGHCLVSYCCFDISMVAFGPRPIARNVCKEPSFGTYHASIAAETDLVQQTLEEILWYNKVILTRARRVRDHRFHDTGIWLLIPLPGPSGGKTLDCRNS